MMMIIQERTKFRHICQMHGRRAVKNRENFLHTRDEMSAVCIIAEHGILGQIAHTPSSADAESVL